MAFTTPGTAVAGEVLTAAFWNTQVRDNLSHIYGGVKNSVVTNVTAATFNTSSTSFTNITNLSVTITPSSSSSKILVFCTASLGPNSAGNPKYGFDITGGNIANIDGVAAGSRIATLTNFDYAAGDTNAIYPLSYVLIDSPATTSAVTYQARVRTAGSTIYLNRSHTDVDANTVYRGASHIGALELIA